MVSRRIKFARWWRRRGALLRGLLLVAAAVGLFLYLLRRSPHDDGLYSGGGLFVFLLVNLNIAALCVLGFVVGRHIVKLIFDRRRNILGSRLRMRLVWAFVGLTLVPTVFLFFMASGLLTRAMEGWFTNQVQLAHDGAVAIARIHYNDLKSKAGTFGRQIAHQVEQRGDLLSQHDELQNFLELQRKEHELFSVRLVQPSGSAVVEAHAAAASIETFQEPSPNPEAIARAFKNEASVELEERESSQFVRAYTPLLLPQFQGALVATIRVDAELTQALSQVKDAYKEYEQLKLFKNPLRSGYLLTFAMITGLILFAAIWFAFYIAREMVVPIQRLAEGTRAVARGNYDFKIRAPGDDELGLLVQSFNQMISDLKNARDESQQRRLYIETILGNLAVGVIALDTSGRVTAVNQAAGRLFELPGKEDDGSAEFPEVIGRPLIEVLPGRDFEQLAPMLAEVDGHDGSEIVEREIAVLSRGRELKIVCTIGSIGGIGGEKGGVVLLFDDVTDLSKAQHMSAWREVARRIAHEIKNPLTPIQLSAQRLARLLGDSSSNETVKECTDTIVQHVDSIKRLANEFSNFARMPTAEFQPSNLNLLISDAIAPFAENNPQVLFQFIADNRMPEIMVDPEQIRRVLINLVDNALAAVVRTAERRENTAPRVIIKSHYERREKLVSFEVADNGPGIPDSDKARVFEPYFTTKEHGTGLGLAIVTSIVSDHQGQIRVYDNSPNGAKFIVELPVSPKTPTQRKFVPSEAVSS